LRLRPTTMLGLILFAALVLPLPFAITPAHAEEPSLLEILSSLGFTSIAESTAGTFPAGLYEAKLYAEFAGYHETNELSCYPEYTSNFSLIFSGSEGDFGYLTPPLAKTFYINSTFGLSMYVGHEDHRYFTEWLRNPDAQNHSKVYANLDEPGMYLIGFENLYGLGDRDFNDMVFSIQPTLHYLTVETDPAGISTIPGEGWYSHCTEVSLSAPNTVAVSPFVRYEFSHWDVDGASQGAGSNPIVVHMNENYTAIAHYGLQYYLTVSSPYGITGGEGWYDNGTTTYATLDTDIVDHGNDTRRVFTHWSGNASGTDYSESNSILMDGPKNAIANWKSQHYLTLSAGVGGTTTPSSSAWYDAGTTVSVTAIPDLDYSFDHWDLDSVDVGSDNPYDVIMDTAHSLHAVFQYSPPPPNYYLDVETDPSGIVAIAGEGWYNESETVLLTAPDLVDVATGIRHAFAYWDINGASQGAGINPITVHMDANYTATAHYTLQYYLTVTSDYGSPTPSSGWFDEGDAVTSTVVSPWPGLAGTRYVCTGWTGSGSVPGTGSGSSTSFVMDEPSSIMWNWKTQHYLTVRTNPPGVAAIPGEGWYDEYASVPLAAPDIDNYRFIDWTVDGSSAGVEAKSISVTMNAPRTAVANYERISIGGSSFSLRAPLLRFWIGLDCLLVVATLATGFWMKRNRKKRTGATW